MHRRLRVCLPDGRTVDVAVPTVAAIREAASGDGWVGLLWPAESDERGVLLAALRLAEAQPEDVSALSVVRAESAADICRLRDVIRVVRPSQLVGLSLDGDENLAVTGEVACLGGEAIRLDRAAAGGATATATAAESEGDWLGAAAAWALNTDGPEPMGAWCELRRGLALARVAPDSAQVRSALASALGRFPGLPEAAMGLAAAAISRGRHGDAIRFIRFAESIGEPPTIIPQPEGCGSWYVPAAASRLLAPVDPSAAARFLQEAMRRGLPPLLSSSLPSFAAEGASTK